MEQETQAELIRQFMVAVAPQVTARSLEIGWNMSENADIVLDCSIQLAAKYNALHETLTTAPQNPTAEGQPEPSAPTTPVHKTQARIPIKKPEVPNLPGSQEQRRPSPLSPTWEPPSPYR